VDSVRLAHGLPALAASVVVRDGGTITVAVSGNRRAGGPAVTTADKWHLGSNLKAITAMLAALAVRRGLITWNSTVAASFPELGASIRTEYRDVTLRELLSMQGGIRNDPPAGAWAGTSARAQRETASAWGLAAAPWGPRGSYYYSNVSYVIAGAMVERAMGGSYESLLQSELGAPVGAMQIGFGPQALSGASDQPVAHRWSVNQWVACEGCDNPPGVSSAGRAHMPMGDWARIILEMLRADAGTSSLVDQATMRTVFTGAVTIPGGADRYGFGWLMTTRNWAGRAATHTGSNTVNHSMAWLGLDTGVAFLVATNAADLDGGRTGNALNALVSRMLTFHLTGR
jgi:CubicO group peptidase (beta-lactamase class C family)